MSFTDCSFHLHGTMRKSIRVQPDIRMRNRVFIQLDASKAWKRLPLLLAVLTIVTLTPSVAAAWTAGDVPAKETQPIMRGDNLASTDGVSDAESNSALTNDGPRAAWQRTPNPVDGWPASRISATPAGTPGSVRSQAETLPSQVQGLTASAGNGEVHLKWWKRNDGDPPITRYEYQVDQADTWQSTGGISTSHSIPGLNNGQSYIFRIRAINEKGEGPPSYPVSTVPGQPAPIEELVAESGGGACKLTLSWKEPNDNGSVITSYQYVIAEGYQGRYSEPKDIALNEIIELDPPQHERDRSYVVQGLNSGTLYRFNLWAVNGHGNPGHSDPAKARPAGPCGPTIEYDLSAAADDGQVALSWNAPDNGEEIIEFQYRRKTGSSAWDNQYDIWRNVPSSKAAEGNRTSYTVTGLTNGTSYRFQVRALYSFGSANDSNDAKATPFGRAMPEFTETDPAGRTVPENTAAAHSIGDPVTATDDDRDTLTYSLSGTDAAYFDIGATNGQLNTKQPLDFEDRASYQVTVSASDGKGNDGQSDTAVDTSIQVNITVTNVNEVPSITGLRNVSYVEGSTGVAGTYSASDPDADDTVTWSLGGTDQASFSLSSEGGLSFGSSPDFENPLDEDTNNDYELTVRATDSGSLWAEMMVTVTVTNLNEPPVFDNNPATRQVVESTNADDPIGEPLAATDGDGDALTYSLSGVDASSFALDDATGQLRTRSPLDYEGKSRYQVVVTATDPSQAEATIDVTINVTNVDEPGTVTLPASQPRVDTQIRATLSDPDGGIAELSWQWARSTPGTGNFTDISSATDQTYTPSAGDQNYYLRATASYTDGHGTGKSAYAVSGHSARAAPPVNQSPSFSPNINDSRSIAENTTARTKIGAPLAATDGDGDVLTYSLSGVDASSFTLDDATGQLRTRSSLDYEGKSRYQVVVTATDPSQAKATIDVAINVTNVDEPGTVTLPASQPRVDTQIRATLSDPDGGIADLSWQWARSTPGTGTFTDISSATGQTYAPSVGDVGNHLRATASYSDGHGTGKSAYAVSGHSARAAPPVNQSPSFSPNINDSRSIAENTTARTKIGAPLAATDGDGDALTYSLSGVDASSFALDDATGQLRTRSPLDYEGKSRYQVVVTATDPSQAKATIDVAINVTNVDEPGTVTLPASQPRVDTQIRATLSDPDGGIAELSWQWARSTPGTGNFTDISSATDQTYTPSVGDVGNHLRATASYSDGHGTGKTSTSVSGQVASTINNKDGGNGDPPEANQQVTVSYSSASYSVNEGDSVRITVKLSEVAPRTLRIPIRLTRGSAEDGDFRLSGLNNGVVSLSEGELSEHFIITALDDEDSYDETVNLALGSMPAGVSRGSVPQAGVTIHDDDPVSPDPIRVGFTSASYSLQEGQGISVTVGLSEVADRPLEIPITVSNKTADAGDYRISRLSDGSLNFEPGDRFRNFTVTALEDEDTADEKANLAFGNLPAGMIIGRWASAPVTIEDDDLIEVRSVAVSPENRPPAFDEGKSTIRSMKEQEPQGTTVGVPIVASDPDGDPLAYFASGEDAHYFSLDAVSGQLSVWGRLDLELQPRYNLTVTASDGRGGQDTINVVIELSDIREVPIISPSTQAVALVRRAGSVTAESPDGLASVSFTEESREAPFFVRVESAAVDCVGDWPPGETWALLTLKIFDTWGDPMEPATPVQPANLGLTFDASDLGGVLAVLRVLEEDRFGVYGYSNGYGIGWKELEFDVNVDTAGISTFTAKGLARQSCYVVIAEREVLLPSQPGPQSIPQTSKTITVEGKSTIERSASPTPTPTLPTLQGVYPGQAEPGPPTPPDLPIAMAGFAGGVPLWPKFFIWIGALLLIAAVAWQFSRCIGERRRPFRRF